MNEWNPKDVAFVKRLSLTPDSEMISDFDLEISFLCQPRNREKPWPNFSEPFVEYFVRFRQVVNFKVDFTSSQIRQFSDLDVRDISDRQLEGINFEVEDYEEGRIHFFCKDIQVVTVFEPRKLLAR